MAKRKAHLQSHEESNCFHRIVPTVYIVSHEEIVGVRGIASDSKKLHQIVELAMYISTYSHGTLDFLHV